jgi:hypothetical protein
MKAKSTPSLLQAASSPVSVFEVDSVAPTKKKAGCNVRYDHD